ncbi:hypothetical protein GALMADRAFT_53029 [Galerina marginata CBS 339.88]|uniref:DRBM domain-containing protein n=1 Tax=Galerina marginata (strain CBS 339.88) TaxID=685588 RepID=A0A067TQB1_GALM3|nr:hypothetical protein GALMADRAFT_53029 [Galerina marginata CBS 339.88]
MNSTRSATYPSVYPPSTTLKRTRSRDDQRKFDVSRLPPLPQIKSDLVLQVFTHKSLRRPNAPPADYGDNERLADLGKMAFEVAITYALFRKRPLLQASDITARTLLFSTMVADWVTYYKLRSKLCCHPDVFSSLNSPRETNTLFHAYVGGLYVTSGPQAVNDWISGLVDQELESMFDEPPSDVDAHPTVEVPPPQKRAKSEAMSPGPLLNQPPIFFASQPPPSPSPPVRRAPAPMPTPAVIPPNPLAPAQPNLPFLPLFNQAAMQRRVTVEYLAEFSGQAHAGRWVVRCIVNGICKGEGTGGTKQTAKEEAARKAYYSMGWT